MYSDKNSDENAAETMGKTLGTLCIATKIKLRSWGHHETEISSGMAMLIAGQIAKWFSEAFFHPFYYVFLKAAPRKHCVLRGSSF